MNRAAFVGISIGLLGCAVSETGANGLVEFTAVDCGARSCDLDRGIGAGGRIRMQIEGREGFATAGRNLASADESVLTVAPAPDIDGETTWEVIAVSAGRTRLAIVDRDTREELDYIEIDVHAIDGLSSFSDDPDIPRGSTIVGTDEGWPIDRGTKVLFWIQGMSGDSATLGRHEYVVTLDPEIEKGLTDPNPETGRLAFEAPEVRGLYYADFEHGDGHVLKLVFGSQ